MFFFVSAGAVHPAGGVPCCGGGRDGREAQPPVVGGLANSGPRPAQPGRSGPGESVTTLQKQTETRKWHSEQNRGWNEEQLITFSKGWSTGSENSCHVGTLVFVFMSFLFVRLLFHLPNHAQMPETQTTDPEHAKACIWGEPAVLIQSVSGMNCDMFSGLATCPVATTHNKGEVLKASLAATKPNMGTPSWQGGGGRGGVYFWTKLAQSWLCEHVSLALFRGSTFSIVFLESVPSISHLSGIVEKSPNNAKHAPHDPTLQIGPNFPNLLAVALIQSRWD